MASSPAGDGGDIDAVGESSRAADGQASPAGRIDVADRVYTRIAEQSVSTVIGVPRQATTVEVAQFRDGLVLRVHSPLPVPRLDDAAAIHGGQPIFERVADIQNALRDQIGSLSGREVVRVDVTVTGAVIAPTRRVK